MKNATGATLITNGQLIDGTGAVLQGGVVKSGQLAKPFPTVVKREK